MYRPWTSSSFITLTSVYKNMYCPHQKAIIVQYLLMCFGDHCGVMYLKCAELLSFQNNMLKSRKVKNDVRQFLEHQRKYSSQLLVHQRKYSSQLQTFYFRCMRAYKKINTPEIHYKNKGSDNTNSKTKTR